ncbi:MAG: hypothetical protein CMB91_02000 [Flammeovirgaceae bacterium]|nr:hypothetical protein [Flammeovirgaceae bacterium]
MKNFFYLFVALLFFSCSESDEAEPDSVKNYLISNIFKETGTYSIFTNNTYQELTATNFIDFKITSSQFNVHYSYHDLLDPNNANCYEDKSMSGSYSILVDNENAFTVQFNSPNRKYEYSYGSRGSIKLIITGESGFGGTFTVEEMLEVTNQQEFDTFKLRAPNEC